MVDVTPGYDFSVNEVPTSANFLKQATGMQISGIGINELEAGVLGIKSGDISNVTDSLQVGETVGTMWISALGDIWVQEQSGPVIMNRIMGGWETRRAFCAPDSSFPNHINPGSAMQIETTGGNGLTEDTARAEVSTSRYTGTGALKCADSGSYEDNASGSFFGVLQQETCVSKQHRVCFRGITMYRDRDFTAAGTWSTLSDMQRNRRLKSPQGAGGNTQMETNSYHFDLPAWKHFGWVGCPSAGSSKVSAASGNHVWRVESMIWAFGHWMWGNRAN